MLTLQPIPLELLPIGLPLLLLQACAIPPKKTWWRFPLEDRITSWARQGRRAESWVPHLVAALNILADAPLRRRASPMHYGNAQLAEEKLFLRGPLASLRPGVVKKIEAILKSPELLEFLIIIEKHNKEKRARFRLA